MKNTASRNKAKTRQKTQRPKYIDSSAEEAYLAYLQNGKNKGEIQAYYLKPGSLRLGEVYYYPDFLVITADGFLEYHEVKSHHRFAAKGISKLKMFAAHYDELTFVLVMAETVKKVTTFELQQIEA